MNLVSKFITTSTVLVTPKLAETMLATSIGNRPLRPTHISNLAGEIRRGEWLINHQGIAFDVNGNLRDGHHRLNAILAAGIPCELRVTLGMPISSNDATDMGIKRSYSDIRGHSDMVSQTLTYAAKLLYGKPSVRQIDALANAGILPLAQEMYDICSNTVRGMSSAPVRLGAVIAVINGADKAAVFTQYSTLVRQDYDAMVPGTKALSRQITKNDLNSANHREELLVRAAYAFSVAGSKLRTLRLSKTDIEAGMLSARKTLSKLLDAANQSSVK